MIVFFVSAAGVMHRHPLWYRAAVALKALNSHCQMPLCCDNTISHVVLHTVAVACLFPLRLAVVFPTSVVF